MYEGHSPPKLSIQQLLPLPSAEKRKEKRKKEMPMFVAAMGSVSRFSSLPHLLLGDSTSGIITTAPSQSLSSSSLLWAIQRQRTKNQHSLVAKVSSLSEDTSTDTELVGDDVSAPISDDLRQARRSADWKAAKAYHQKGFIYNARIEGFNGGGLLLRFYSLVGFLPYPHLSPSYSCKEPNKSIQEIAKNLVGSLISVKVIQVDEDQRKLIFSEKEALWFKYSQQINLGDIFIGKVGSVEDYGAFIHLLFPDGLYHLTGLVHVSEVSWDLVRDVRDILSEGDEVRVKIIKIDRVKSRITLSIKQLEEDPLFETLDKVIPQNGSIVPDSSGTSGAYNIEPLPGLEAILEGLKQEDGIIDVRINRQGFEKRVVSQDLQLWLSNAPAIGKQFALLARAGRQVQEIQLTTLLDQDGIKSALQRVLERIP